MGGALAGVGHEANQLVRQMEAGVLHMPLLELAPELRHSVSKEPLKKYLKKLQGQKVRKL